jgi:hypothetical protein
LQADNGSASFRRDELAEVSGRAHERRAAKLGEAGVGLPDLTSFNSAVGRFTPESGHSVTL